MSDWSRRTFLSAAGAFLLPRQARARLLAPAGGGAAPAARLAEIDTVASRGPFTPSWESLEGFKVPQWYLDGKFGIFIHWGVYSVPAFGNEWYPRNMYKAGTDEFKHHVATYGPQARFGYKDFIPLFKAERFDARQWASLFKAGGREVRRARGRASRRLPHVRLSLHGVVARPGWGPGATSSASSPRPFARPGSSSALPPIAPSTGGSSTRG